MTLVKPTTPHSSSGIFPVLNSLEISYARRLKEIFHGELPTGSLKEIRSLKIEFCSSLEGIFAFEDDEEMFNFQSLTELTLSTLPSFTGISKYISNGSEWLLEDISPEQSDIIIQPLFDTKVHFPVLTKVYIISLNLKEIWNSQLSAESFCELKYLGVTGCHKLLRLVPTHMQNRLQKLECIYTSYCSSLEEIFEFRRLTVDDEGDAAALTISESRNQSRQAFQNLREISIFSCESLRTLLSPSIARGLVKLQRLKIKDCEKIEEIVAAAEGEETEDDNLFPQLCTLTLEDLPNLSSFSQGRYNFKWPLVKDIKVLKCYNMKRFCLGSLSTPKEVKIDVQGASKSVLQVLNNSRNRI
ncbi:uncharacterized protein LOC133707029 [Rosa rugosa]|uniref:uncharacterized protein LOC133707029 n=1 Tax=Rosa rugosa TaxID=74645 RepID=UPI002B40C92A|nr:uncharacterized protein LOC133707029 [Rosa rugosa]